jgi:hypothetical protein
VVHLSGTSASELSSLPAMIDRPGLTRHTELPFVDELVDGLTIATVGDVDAYLRKLNGEQQLRSHGASPYACSKTR